MSGINLSRRFAFLLLLAVSIAITNCTVFYKQTKQEVFCTRGNGSASRPMICVDEKTLTPNPKIADVYDVEEANSKMTDRPVVVHWFTQRTANLGVEFITKGCVEHVACNGFGECSVRVIKLSRETYESKPKGHKDCKYRLNLNGMTSAGLSAPSTLNAAASERDLIPPPDDAGETGDDQIIVNPCCW